MNYYFAPMEGVTSYIYRNAHQKYFGGVDKYFMPFLSPGQDEKFSKKEMRDVILEHNQNIAVVPQLLTKHPAHFLWATNLMADLGYTEINLNLGCPSGTVVAKGKGSGFLGVPLDLKKFLDEIFEKSSLPISIKTRVGRWDEEEFSNLLAIFKKYPMTELIIHPRVQQDFYRQPVRLSSFQLAVDKKFSPLCYNGDIYTTGQNQMILEKFPQIDGVMLGRGLIANPALASQCRGGADVDGEILGLFLEEVFEGYAQAFDSYPNAMLRMKELWFYLADLFEGSEKPVKHLRKTRNYQEYQQIQREILQGCPIRAQLEGQQSSII